MSTCRAAVWLSIATLGGAVTPGFAAEPTAEQLKHFESKVRPVLVEKCQSCHGPDKQKSGLRVDSRDALLVGGDSGPALDQDELAKSLLLDAINYGSLQMPPDRRLPDAEIAAITEWVKQGAPWPGSGESAGVPVRKRGLEITAEDQAFWSFQPIRKPPVPEVKGSANVRNAIDNFIIVRLEADGLSPSPVAEPRSLVRRLSFDLLGLPPDLKTVAEFTQQPTAEAYDKLIDAWLMRPEFGERWGRHWLDLVRFAQTNGLERDDEKPEAWRFRDYVIRSFNEDKPYDQFIKEQLAGDELSPVTDDGLIATGFYRLGVWDDEPDDNRQAEFDELDDMLATTGSVFLGLSIGCARCHDHKFDPLPQEDYYGLLAFLRNVKPYAKPGKESDGVLFAPLASGGKALAVFDSLKPLPTNVLARGSAASPGKEVTPHYPRVFSPDLQGDAPALPEVTAESKSLGRRKLLADWITKADHPLTARVMVNRLWHYHFGRGLVATPNDFGHTGSAPSHPELLDYLASELIAGGWRLKPLHRLILQSATYRQSSQADHSLASQKDPANTLFWRQNLRRLEAEAIRDAMLATSGQLNPKMGGRGVFPALSPEVLATQSVPGRGWDKSPASEQARRSVYVFVKRTLGVPQLESFDQASPDSSQASRNTTTIAPQALILLNGTFAEDQSRAFAERLLYEVGSDMPAIVERAFEQALVRKPTAVEARTALGYVEQQRRQALQLPSTIAEKPVDDTELLGWKTFAGKWGLREDGGYAVEPHPGAKALWQGGSTESHTWENATIEAEVWLGKGHDAGLLIRATEAAEGTDNVVAYNINVMPGRIRLGKHRHNWRELVAKPAEIEPNSWVRVRVVVEGNRLQVFLRNASEPVIDYTDDAPLPAGQIGFRTFQAAAAVRAITVRSGDAVTAIPLQLAPRPTVARTTSADRWAVTQLCKVLLNLNEFVYVD